MTIKKIVLTLFIFFSIPLCFSQQLDYDPVEFEVIDESAIMTGIIDSDILDTIEDLLEDYPQVTTIVMQDVEGSVDDEANLNAARYIRQIGLNTHIPKGGLVASGGTDFFLAGVKRTAHSRAKIGVHSWADSDDIEGIELPKNHPEHRRYINYYKSLDIPTEFYWFTLRAAPSDNIHWMTKKEKKRYKITTH